MPQPEPPRPVQTVVVGVSDSVGVLSFSGDVHARHEAPLGFRIAGKITARLVDPGAAVRAGQPLARLDPSDVALQTIQIEAQHALALAETGRYRELRAKNFISQSALDVRETALKAAEAEAGQARNQQDYATLRADADGVVVAVFAEPGQVVAAGAPVLRLARDGEREVAVSIPESVMRRFKVGDAAEITLWADEAKVYRGRIRELSPAADPATRTYPARISLRDADAAVALGMTARVSFRDKAEAALRVPATAIYQQGDQPAVWLVGADSVVTVRPVKVLRWSDDAAVIGAGLKPGERIVASGVHKLHAGEKVVFDSARR